MVLVSFINSITWASQPSLSDFVTELSILYKRPKYQIRVYYAFDAVYFTFIERKIYILLFNKKTNLWSIGFIHTSVVTRNYIPLIQETLNAIYN